MYGYSVVSNLINKVKDKKRRGNVKKKVLDRPADVAVLKQAQHEEYEKFKALRCSGDYGSHVKLSVDNVMLAMGFYKSLAEFMPRKYNNSKTSIIVVEDSNRPVVAPFLAFMTRCNVHSVNTKYVFHPESGNVYVSGAIGVYHDYSGINRLRVYSYEKNVLRAYDAAYLDTKQSERVVLLFVDMSPCDFDSTKDMIISWLDVEGHKYSMIGYRSGTDDSTDALDKCYRYSALPESVNKFNYVISKRFV